MVRLTVLSTTVILVLGMAATAGAAQHWRGPGWGGDGTSWSDVLNWDDTIPWNTSWDVNVTGEQGTPSNHVINVDQSGTVTVGTIAAQAGYTVTMTVLSGITLTTANPNGVNWNGAGSLTIQSNATWDMRYGQLDLEISSATVTIEDGGLIYCGTLRHNNGAKMDVYGDLRAFTVSRIATDPGYRLAVYDGGLFRVDSGVPAPGVGWGRGGKVTQYVGSTVMLAGDHTGHYLELVQAGEAGAWDVLYQGGYTYITYYYNPCNPIVFADVDGDGDVDQYDFSVFQLCYTGDGGGIPADPDYCRCFDRRNNDNTPGQDGDIDGFDLEAFEACASGPGVTTIPPACGN
jgi:hypothetical protein